MGLARSFLFEGLFITDPATISLQGEEYGFRQDYKILDDDLWRCETVGAPLTTRGWVLQEEILARRTLLFGRRQVLWKCRHGHLSEIHPGETQTDDSALQADLTELLSTRTASTVQPVSSRYPE